MARRKKGNPVHGWVVLDKPIGMTSTQAVGAVRRLFGAQKAGHAGTLDPLATGILPIALGEATKTVPFAVDGEKSYRFSVRFGAETDTDDAEGKVVRTSDVLPSPAEIEDILEDFIGEISQVPPAFSAIKINGNRAYDLARSGEQVVLEARTIVVDDLRLVAMADEATAVLEADCGKGTYVRALARDMGRMLGSAAHVVALRRTRVGGFDEEIAIPLVELVEAAEQGDVMSYLQPVEAALDEIPGLSMSQNDAANLSRGQSVLVRGRDAPVMTGAAWAHFKGRILALGELEKGEFRPTRVFNFG
ncbi:tRNA pseudouridine(55) synthase TruB [Hyphomicrobium sulfonivorans]|uniref:tRNA pseudouridine(55) synthase TruB n=1 Tax=Hyphomicrobium sulfonivorans TaxID=121290 RepID=UPI00156F7977|nr:tRNA pseudouridine(55) synthase TruB [Hyphomicrobium sulfonivorans]MBI1651286.1 tRNA pseudouridine(55) synthase TruB [Hyphomicrobium sulfonivorans]NSL73253.1 tRNA pseudouridine(55) synthase TruB [Hyphomicrobium sulfonivorans]